MPSKTDKNGRPYATVAETKVGDKLEADGGFTCIAEGAVLEVKQDGDGLYVECNGHGDFDAQADHGVAEHPHLLSGQEESGIYIGLYRVEA